MNTIELQIESVVDSILSDYAQGRDVDKIDLRLMETIKSCDIFKNHVLYSDSYLDL